MLRLLRNMKMSTKLFTVLAAPVAVLLLLSIIGVTSRRSEANDANRIKQLSEFVQVDSNLVNELQKEAIWSAAYMSTIDENLNVDQAKKDEYAGQLDAQRQKTDAGPGRLRNGGRQDQPGPRQPRGGRCREAGPEPARQPQDEPHLRHGDPGHPRQRREQLRSDHGVADRRELLACAERERRRAAARSDHGRELRAGEGRSSNRDRHPHLGRGARCVQQPGRPAVPGRHDGLHLLHRGPGRGERRRPGHRDLQ